MPRYVILLHQTPPEYSRGIHWDLMLEREGSLATWALEREPRFGVAIGAEKLPDHRLEYLSYEGDISGGRGVVKQWDAGEYVMQSSKEHVTEEPELQLELKDGQMEGLLALRRLSDDNSQIQRWEVLFFESDSRINSSECSDGQSMARGPT